MGDISRALAALKEDFESANNLVDELYHKYFAQYFEKETELYTKFRNEEVSISDKDLEWILISLPLDIKMASSALAQFKQYNEIVKLKIKSRKAEHTEDEDGMDEEFKLMSIIYTSVITRVEHDISFSKELIMGAKKVWDARRASESAPIREMEPQDRPLPDYQFSSSEMKF